MTVDKCLPLRLLIRSLGQYNVASENYEVFCMVPPKHGTL
jgi:hypothetical protein